MPRESAAIEIPKHPELSHVEIAARTNTSKSTARRAARHVHRITHLERAQRIQNTGRKCAKNHVAGQHRAADIRRRTEQESTIRQGLIKTNKRFPIIRILTGQVLQMRLAIQKPTTLDRFHRQRQFPKRQRLNMPVHKSNIHLAGIPPR